MFIVFGILGVLLLFSTEAGWPMMIGSAAVVFILFQLIPAERTVIKWIKALITIAAVYALWRFFSTVPAEWVVKTFTPAQLKVIHWAAIASCAGAAGLGAYRFIKNLKPAGEKDLKHGPEFCGRAAGAHAGIIIGDYTPGVLPELVRSFAVGDKFPLVIPYDRLSRGVTILADQGAGKTRLMKAMHDGITMKYPDVPVLIHDPKGEWLRALYNPETDLIFAPHDARTCGWRLWEDFKNHPELKHSLITTAVESHHSGNTDRFWSDSAVQLLKTAVSKPGADAALKYLLMKKKENSDDKTFQSIYATAALSFRDLAAIEQINKEAATTKTINEMLAHKGRIFLLNSPSCAAEQHGALTLLLSAFLLQAISMPDMEAGQLRAAVLIDEALTFRLPSAVERVVYSQSRSKGLCLIASAQRLPSEAYGERGMWAHQANHIFAMRVSDLKTREAFSQRIGKLIFDEEQSSNSTTSQPGQFGSTNGTTTTEVERHYSAMSPESFGALQNREFILFHDLGVAPGVVVDTAVEQRADIKPIDYTARENILEFLADL